MGKCNCRHRGDDIVVGHLRVKSNGVWRPIDQLDLYKNVYAATDWFGVTGDPAALGFTTTIGATCSRTGTTLWDSNSPGWGSASVCADVHAGCD